MIPTGWLLRDDPQISYLTLTVSTPTEPIDQEELSLLCPEWRLPERDTRHTSWKDNVGDAFELGEDCRSTWYSINLKDFSPLRWLVQDFLVTTIRHMECQLRWYLNLYPGNKYHTYLIRAHKYTVLDRQRALEPLPLPPPFPPPPSP